MKACRKAGKGFQSLPNSFFFLKLGIQAARLAFAFRVFFFFFFFFFFSGAFWQLVESSPLRKRDVLLSFWAAK